MDAIESSDVLSDDLREDDLLKNDVSNVVAMISRHIPFLGFLSCGITTAKHVYDYKTKNNPKENETTKTE